MDHFLKPNKLSRNDNFHLITQWPKPTPNAFDRCEHTCAFTDLTQ